MTEEQREFLRAGHCLVLLNRPRYPIIMMWLVQP